MLRKQKLGLRTKPFLVGVGILSLLLLIPPPVSAEVVQPMLDLVYLTNQARLDHRLPPLVLNTKLTQAAHAKAEDMLKDNYFDHVSPDGREPWDFIERTSYPYVFAGENLAINYGNAQETFDAWLSSEKHRDNILFSYYQEVGLATHTAVLTGKTITVTVQMFGSRADFMPPTTALVNRPATPQRTEALVDARYLDPTENSGYVASAVSLARRQAATYPNPKSPLALVCLLGGWFLSVVGLMTYLLERRIFLQIFKKLATAITVIALMVMLS